MTTTEIALLVFGVLVGIVLTAVVVGEIAACGRSSQISRELEEPPVEGEEEG